MSSDNVVVNGFQDAKTAEHEFRVAVTRALAACAEATKEYTCQGFRVVPGVGVLSRGEDDIDYVVTYDNGGIYFVKEVLPRIMAAVKDETARTRDLVAMLESRRTQTL